MKMKSHFASYRSAATFLALVLTAALTLTAAAGAQQTAFADESLTWGVLFQHKDMAGADTMGGGAAFFDYDGDGDEDLFVTSSDGYHKLFKHTGKKFVDVTTGSGLADIRFPMTMGVIVADYNQDGRPDLYVTNRGPNQLYTNLGGGKFRDDANALGVDGNEWSVSAAWADFDRDGDLDLYVGDYIATLNFPYHRGSPNRLYVNTGTTTQPKFVDMAVQLGVDDFGLFHAAVPGFPYPKTKPSIFPGAPTWGCTLSVSTWDFDDDGDQDLLIGNDFGAFVLPNRLYRNDTIKGGSLRFTDVSKATGFSFDSVTQHYDMGISGSDYDNDGDWDFYMASLGPNVLLRNEGGSFIDVTAAAGPVEGWNDKKTLLLSSWGSVFCDFDNDLYEDLFVINGFIRGAAYLRNDPRSQNHLWMNRGDGTFARVDPVFSGAADPGAGRGMVASDVNKDGRMDFYVMNNGGIAVAAATDRCRLFVNQGLLGGSKNHWSQLRLHGWSSNKEALGARVKAEVGGQVLQRQVLADPVYLSSGTRLVHLGLGKNTAVDRLTIEWPSGLHQEIITLPGDLRLDLHEPRVTMNSVDAPAWSNGQMRFPVQLKNHQNRNLLLRVSWFLHLGKGGPLVATFEQAAVLTPYESRSIQVSIPVPQATRAALSGVVLDQRAYIVSDGAVDSRRRVDKLK